MVVPAEIVVTAGTGTEKLDDAPDAPDAAGGDVDPTVTPAGIPDPENVYGEVEDEVVVVVVVAVAGALTGAGAGAAGVETAAGGAWTGAESMYTVVVVGDAGVVAQRLASAVADAAICVSTGMLLAAGAAELEVAAVTAVCVAALAASVAALAAFSAASAALNARISAWSSCWCAESVVCWTRASAAASCWRSAVISEFSSVWRWWGVWWGW